MTSHPTFEIADGSLTLWLDETGAIRLKVREPLDDAVELAEHEALGLAALLLRLAMQPGVEALAHPDPA